MSITVNIQMLDSSLDDIQYAHEGDAGFDLRSSENIELTPGAKELVGTGVKMAIPRGYVGLIWDRSGLAARNGVHVLAGVVDSGYRGEVKVVLKNLGDEAVAIEKNMRIAQMLIQPVAEAAIQQVGSLEETTRGDGGFGSTGTD